MTYFTITVSIAIPAATCVSTYVTSSIPTVTRITVAPLVAISIASAGMATGTSSPIGSITTAASTATSGIRPGGACPLIVIGLPDWSRAIEVILRGRFNIRAIVIQVGTIGRLVIERIDIICRLVIEIASLFIHGL